MPTDQNDDQTLLVTQLLRPARRTTQFARALAMRHALPTEPFAGETKAIRNIESRPDLHKIERRQSPIVSAGKEWFQPNAPHLRELGRPHLDLSLSRPPVPVASWLGLSPPEPERQIEWETATVSPPPPSGITAMREFAGPLTVSAMARKLRPSEAVNYTQRPSTAAHPAMSSRPTLLRTAAELITPAAEHPLVTMQMPVRTDPMEQKIPSMPLFRAGDAGKDTRDDGAIIQRSAVGENPAGNAHPSAQASAGAAADGQREKADAGDGGGSDVTLLAGEVWALLKRRLAVEAERSGRR